MENLVLLHKVDVSGLSHNKAKQTIASYVNMINDQYSDIDDIKITNLFLPIKQGSSDVKVLYPVPSIITDSSIIDEYKSILTDIRNLFEKEELV